VPLTEARAGKVSRVTKVQVRAGLGVHCPNCQGEVHLVAAMALRDVTLCPACDAQAPAAQGLLRYFALHKALRPQDASEVSGLVGQWLAAVTAQLQAKHGDGLAAEAEAWWARYK
jgi:hypothetical protein